MKWIKSPWRIEGRYIRALKGKTIAEIPCGGVIHNKIDEANARLIVNAPVMAGLLIEVVRQKGFSCDCGLRLKWNDEVEKVVAQLSEKQGKGK